MRILTREVFKSQRLLLLAFLLLHTAASFYYISHQNVTFDEPQYLEYAKRWLHGKPERIEPLDDSKSPIVFICWFPRIIKQIVQPNYHLSDYGRKDQEQGRYMMIFFSLITAIYVYKWCVELYGSKYWQLPLLLLLFDPLYLSYSTIITTDLACGTFLVALLYHYRKYLLNRDRKQLVLAAIFTGIALVTKQTMLFTVLLLPLIYFVFIICRQGIRINFSDCIVNILIFTLIIILIINVAYYFYNSFIPFGQYTFTSNTFRQLQQYFSFLGDVPVPFPHPYIQSLDVLKAHAELGPGKPLSTYNGVFLFEQLKLTGNFWYYYIVLLYYKLPIGTLIFIAASVAIFFKKFKRPSFTRNYLFLVLPILFFFIILSFINQFQIGVRHILLVFPLLFVGLGKLFQLVEAAKLPVKIITGSIIAYIFITVAIYYPYIIPYTNEFITDKKTVYKKIMDSSIDYGQSDSSINHFIACNPGYKKETSVPDTGRFIVLMDHVLNTSRWHNNPYDWYQKLSPSGLHKYVILLYDIKEEDLVKAGIWK